MHFFSVKMQEAEYQQGGIKPLYPTPLDSIRTEAINDVIKQYSIIMETMEEVSHTTHDDCGLKAAGVVAALEKFETLFGLKLGHLLFGTSEGTSKVLHIGRIYQCRK